MTFAPPLPARSLPFRWQTRVLLWLYGLAWHLMLPVFLLFLWRRGRKEPLYRQHWGERFGRVVTALQRPVWVHSASMGELRGAAPLIRALLARGYPVLVSTLTPAGRTAAHTLFADDMAAGRLQVCFVPLELGWAVRRFVAHTRPRAALMTEIDTWPVLLSSIRRCGVPLGMANAQYPRKSIERDQRVAWGFRADIFRAYQLVMCKSETHARRFRAVGCERVEVVGETRFDLPPSPAHLAAGEALLQPWNLATGVAGGRPVLCFASAIVGEDEPFIDAIQQVRQGVADAGLPPLLVVYVPRSPQRFDTVADLLTGAGLRVSRRSRDLDPQLEPLHDAPAMDGIDVLLGDSLGEMYFYLALSQVVVVGASFVPMGAHNVIEPLALRKPVMVGPSIWGIEYPGVEALEAGVLQQHGDIPSLARALIELLTSPQRQAQATAGAEAFYAEHGGSTRRHMAVLQPWLEACA